MEFVEHLPRRLAPTHPVEEGLITLPPCVSNRGGIDGQVALPGDRREFGNYAAAPVDDGSEDVEGEHLQAPPPPPPPPPGGGGGFFSRASGGAPLWAGRETSGQ